MVEAVIFSYIWRTGLQGALHEVSLIQCGSMYLGALQCNTYSSVHRSLVEY